ncbi:DUF368 domain-containing protein [Natronococcus sp. JC468]|uniref:DUF368 domain-containing protein n=1 Tax=Natronococcus sp. JC468 TaxID=1961921 RepID=UPI00143967E6|nr:DUF368 domain-containing protein [Natronococcus sp. JC468]NKE36882.1 DUF368 domain-containing protein [Natronococcus sp. JC468]
MLHALERRLGPRFSVLRVYCYGLCMGTADALPGVSGGTVALLLGFYGRLIAAVTAFTPRRAIDVLRGYDAERRDRAREALLEMDLQFLLPLGVGIVTAVAIIAEAVTVLAESHPLALFGFFIGLIAASAIVLFRTLTFASARHVLSAATGTGIALLVSANVLELPGSGPLLIFLSGALAVSAMILPGVSGSLILILLGQYVFLSGELSAFLGSIRDLLLADGTLAAVADPGATVVVFVAGGVVGLVSIARIVRHALDRQRELTLLFLVGLIAGSVPAPLHNVAEAHPLTIDVLLQTAVWAGLGALALFALDRLAGGFDPE